MHTANDLNDAFRNGLPTEDLARQVAEGATHHVGAADRVVLGKWDGQDGGYIGEARHNGGVYFDTGDPVWQAVERGLPPDQSKLLGWQVNEQFLRMQLEDGVSRIEYVLDSRYPTLEDVVLERQGSFSAMEIEYLTEHAADYGYHRVGNSWVKDQ